MVEEDKVKKQKLLGVAAFAVQSGSSIEANDVTVHGRRINVMVALVPLDFRSPVVNLLPSPPPSPITGDVLTMERKGTSLVSWGSMIVAYQPTSRPQNSDSRNEKNKLLAHGVLFNGSW
ncbi:hypothetical protein NC653_036103 [Populus alba x Populus x berolinensis]|uniref:Uncharacterized protein n=1 Tax=Populus alba x Populus x berolinensis TaxID=444605 RepID=A0AAD6LJC3_9ROSI|nr:hypothetical protein NC653_036103 [Populus alba x Populus x berolinensis]